MQCLKIPEQFINIIKNSLKYRTNRVIIDLGLTEKYSIKYGLNETLIYPEKRDESTRFLGVWIAANNNKNFIKKQVKKDAETIHSLARGKTITAEQMTYVHRLKLILSGTQWLCI